MSGRDRWYGATIVEDNGPRIDLQNSASASHQAIKGRVTYFIIVIRPVNLETAEAQDIQGSASGIALELPSHHR